METKALSANRFQPRRLVDEESIKSLAESIKSRGMIQPIVAREREGKLEIIVGERRWRAAEMAKVATVPVMVREADDQEALELALSENLHRADRNARARAVAGAGPSREWEAGGEPFACALPSPIRGVPRGPTRSCSRVPRSTLGAPTRPAAASLAAS